MFESALGRYEGARSRLGSGAILSIAAHALVALAVIGFPNKKHLSDEDMRDVVFVAPPKPPALLGTPGGPKIEKVAEAPKPRRPKSSKVPILTKETPETPPETDPAPEEPAPGAAGDGADEPGDGNGGDPNGDPNGVIGGEVGGTGKAPPPPEPEKPQNIVMNLTSDMGRPVLVGGSTQPPYPHGARSARVETTVVAQCVITTSGSLRDCRIVKGHPLFDPTVLAALAEQRYQPIVYQGRPVNIRFTQVFRFKLQ